MAPQGDVAERSPVAPVSEQQMAGMLRRLEEYRGQLLTAADVAYVLGVKSTRTVTAWARPDGPLDGEKRSNAHGWRFTCEKVKNFIDGHYDVVPAGGEVR
jgi:hypothetical protein